MKKVNYAILLKTRVKLILFSLFFVFSSGSLFVFGHTPQTDHLTGHIGDGYCTCKNKVCQDGNWIGFRKVCGNGDSDGTCSLRGKCS